MKIEVMRVIAAPPEIVFGTALDLARWPEFITGIKAVEVLTPGPIGVGTRFRETRIMFGREATEEMTFAEIKPPHAFVLTAESHGTRYRSEHILAAEGAGTRLTLGFEGRPITLTARLLMPLGLMMRGSIRRHLEGDLADVAREAERRRR